MLAGALLLGACATPDAVFSPRLASSAPPPGSVHLTVLSVAPWSDYATKLRPQFNLTGDEALDKVVRDTRSRKVTSRNSAGIAVAHSETQSDSSGSSSHKDANDSDKTLLKEHEPLSTDAMLQYSAATALYQEVQLLNGYLADAAIPAGFEAFVVRVQISLMPRRRHQPYDTYTTVSFFTPDADISRGDVSSARAGALLLDVPMASPVNGEKHPASDVTPNEPSRVLSVIPLVVTDNLEASIDSRTAYEASQLALSLLFLTKTTSTLDLEVLQRELKSMARGRDLNSLLTLARISENTLRIRIGAVQEATTDYAMVPRNHNVTLLLMVPREAPQQVQVVAKTSFFDVSDGKELTASGSEELEAAWSQVEETYELKELDGDVRDELRRHAQRNEQREFFALLHDNVPPEAKAWNTRHALWVDLVSMVVGSKYLSAHFELPQRETLVEGISEACAAQTAVVRDDGVDVACVELQGVCFSASSRITCELELQPNIVLGAEAVTSDPIARTLSLRFPSLKAMKLGENACSPDALTLRVKWGDQSAALRAQYLLHAAPVAGKEQ
jgi:hypothetical protein